MARKISFYTCPFDLQDHEYPKLYHKAKLRLKEDDKYYLSKEKIKNFCMEFRFAGQTFHWEEVMLIPSQIVQSTGQPVLRLNVINTPQMYLLRNGISLTK